MDAGDTGRLELVTNSAQEMERRLPYSVDCICGEKVTTENHAVCLLQMRNTSSVSKYSHFLVG